MGLNLSFNPPNHAALLLAMILIIIIALLVIGTISTTAGRYRRSHRARLDQLIHVGEIEEHGKRKPVYHDPTTGLNFVKNGETLNLTLSRQAHQLVNRYNRSHSWWF